MKLYVFLALARFDQICFEGNLLEILLCYDSLVDVIQWLVLQFLIKCLSICYRTMSFDTPNLMIEDSFYDEDEDM